MAIMATLAVEPAMATRIVGDVVTGTVTSVSYDKITVDGKVYSILPGSKLAQTHNALKVGQRVILDLTLAADGKLAASDARSSD